MDVSLGAELRDLRDRIRDLETANPLQNSSVSDGRLRFIAGQLLLEAASLLTGEGTFNWTGPGSIAGDWEVLGGGVIKVGGVLISPVGGGRIMIGQGPVGIILDGGTGSLTMGNVRIEAGKVYIGDMVLDPAVAGGALTFPNGSRLEADADNAGERMVAGDAVVNVGQVASIRKGDASVILSAVGMTLNGGGGAPITLLGEVRIPLASVPTYTGTGLPEGTLRLSSTGRLERADGN